MHKHPDNEPAPPVEKVTLEYIGPPGQAVIDEDGRHVELVVGRRYQMSPALAAFRVEHDTGHWKRPEPKAGAAAAKE
jgi:hypothetical protein